VGQHQIGHGRVDFPFAIDIGILALARLLAKAAQLAQGIAKVDSPSGMGFSVRVGAEFDVIVSASGRVLLAFQTDETRQFRIAESVKRRPDHDDPQILPTLDLIRARGFKSIPSVQIRGLYAVAFPILNTRGVAIAALTVPYAERIDQLHRKPISAIEGLLEAAAGDLSSRVGGLAHQRTQ